MISVELNNAQNGIIKKVIDTQYNGVDQRVEMTNVYEFDKEDQLQYFVRLMELLEDLTRDLGIKLGSDFDSAQFQFDVNWGDKYTPSIEEINDRIKEYQVGIKELKELKKIIENDGIID